MSRCERMEICPVFDVMTDRTDKRMLKYCRGEYRKCARRIALQTIGPADTPRDLYPDDHRRLQELTVAAGA
jgi:hypothetical protein